MRRHKFEKKGAPAVRDTVEIALLRGALVDDRTEGLGRHAVDGQ